MSANKLTDAIKEARRKRAEELLAIREALAAPRRDAAKKRNRVRDMVAKASRRRNRQ